MRTMYRYQIFPSCGHRRKSPFAGKPAAAERRLMQSSLTNFNVAVSVISLFVLIAKMIAVIMHLWYPVVALFFNVALTALYTTSVYGQMGPDYADSNHPSPIAWYIAKPCTAAANQSVQKSCRTAKGTYAATIIFLLVFKAPHYATCLT